MDSKLEAAASGSGSESGVRRSLEPSSAARWGLLSFERVPLA